MPDNVPFDVHVEIMKRLPVISLLRLRSASKAWKSLIHSSDFIAHYSSKQHLLVNYTDAVDFERKYVSLVDDDTFPQHKVSLNIPLLVKSLQVKSSVIVGISHGLLCLYGDYQQFCGTARIVIWNPSIRKVVGGVVPITTNKIHATVLGFGVCRETTDPKIVKVTGIDRWKDIESVTLKQVEVFTLSTGVWRSPLSNLPRKSIQFNYLQVVIDGVLYWLATDKITIDGRLSPYSLIISIDITSEEFTEINLPYSLSHKPGCNVFMSKLRESLVVLERGVEATKQFFHVWMMGMAFLNRLQSYLLLMLTH